ncbi:MAG: response regulator [Polyangiaceae bacterium]|nr:response regulator [Polyangiaceae bacterium]
MADSELAAALSQEVVLSCDDQGTIGFLDARAERAFGDVRGRGLASLAVPGTESKVIALLRAGRERRVEGWELSLVVGGAPATLTFHAAPHHDSTVLVGSFVSERYNGALRATAEATHEISQLHREAEKRRRELAALNQELRESNQGLVRLHAELDEKNHALRRNHDVKSRVVANVSHEFRTPINSILGLTQLLLDRIDGDLNTEQEKQLRFVRTSAKALGDLVNDLLDLSRIESGKEQLRATEFTVEELLSSMRGMMRPLSTSDAVKLVFDPPPDLPPLNTDQGKLAQILRNLVSNALKFTHAGEVRVSTRLAPDGKVSFLVADTGIGISEDDQERIFEEFVQIDGELQRKTRGTGLGLALSRKLAELLGGSLTVTSGVGEGSVFTLTVPPLHEEVAAMLNIEKSATKIDPSRAPVLVIEDDRQTMFLYERYLSSSGFQVIPARTVDDARAALERVRPASIVLDIMLEGEATWQFLADLKADPTTRDIPLMVVTVMDRAQKRARALGADEFWLKPIDGDRLIRKVGELSRRTRETKVLVIDDDEAARYLVRRLLHGTGFSVIDTADGAEGVRLAKAHAPQVILLDFVLQGGTAFDVLDDLRADPRTRNIPVIIQTSQQLDDAERERLARETAAILAKDSLSRELAITRIREALIAAGVSSAGGSTSEGNGHA